MLRNTIAMVAGMVVLATSSFATAAVPLEDALRGGASATVVLFHPSDMQSVAQLDGMAASAAAGVLAVCVGSGCSGNVSDAIARERGWPFTMAHVSAADAVRLLGTAEVPATVQHESRADRVLSTLRPALQPKAPQTASAPGAMSATMSTPAMPRLVSARGFLLIALPLLLLGLGGAALYFGSRKNGDRPVEEMTEEERLQQYVAERHGRKRPVTRA